MRQQPKHYARIEAYGLNTVVSLSEVSRLTIEPEADHEFERCLIIRYTDDSQHVLQSAALRSREDGEKALHHLMERLSAAIRDSVTWCEITE